MTYFYQIHVGFWFLMIFQYRHHLCMETWRPIFYSLLDCTLLGKKNVPNPKLQIIKILMVSTTNYWSEKGTRTHNYPWHTKKGKDGLCYKGGRSGILFSSISYSHTSQPWASVSSCIWKGDAKCFLLNVLHNTHRCYLCSSLERCSQLTSCDSPHSPWLVIAMWQGRVIRWVGRKLAQTKKRPVLPFA